MDEVFKALADPSRRRMLDLVKAKPGINVNELSAQFEFSRYATMKHIKILEKAKLLTSNREWKEKKLYLNAVPIQTIYNRWISKYSGALAKGLTNLKELSEKD